MFLNFWPRSIRYSFIKGPYEVLFGCSTVFSWCIIRQNNFCMSHLCQQTRNICLFSNASQFFTKENISMLFFFDVFSLLIHLSFFSWKNYSLKWNNMSISDGMPRLFSSLVFHTLLYVFVSLFLFQLLDTERIQFSSFSLCIKALL